MGRNLWTPKLKPKVAPDQRPVHERQNDLVIEVGQQLADAVGRVTLEEFQHQEAHFDEDSWRGRELLYLAANNEWVRGTREFVDLAASRTVETTVQVHVDLAKITHEAVRDRVGPIWLPLLILAPPTSSRSETAPTPSQSTPPPVPTPAVLDATGEIVPSLPQSQARRWIAAALAEIIQQMTPLVADENGGPNGADGNGEGRTGRERRLLLSAAIYRVLRDGATAAELDPVAEPADPGSRRVTRVGAARDELVRQLAGFENTVRASQIAANDRGTLLIRRAARVIHAVTSPTTIVVVAAPAARLPTEYSVQVPSRPLTGDRRAALLSLRARIELGLLLPSGEADRSLTVRLPEGVSYQRRPAESGSVRPRIEVERPPSWRRLDELIRQFSAESPIAVQQCLADLALTQLDGVRETFRYHYYCKAKSESDAWLKDVRTALVRAQLGTGDRVALTEALTSAWAVGEPRGRRLRRIVQSGVVNPATAHVRLPAIEDQGVRTSPASAGARVRLSVLADEPSSIYTARFSGLMNIAVLALAIILLWRSKHVFDAQVLGGVLTIFAAIQASRIEQPDRSTLRGLLVSAGSVLAALSVMPTVLLGVALAFPLAHEPRVIGWAVSALVLQMLLLAAPEAWLRLTRWRGIGPRLKLTVGVGLDHSRVDVLHTSWWRTTTAGALLLGRPAHAYVVQQSDHDLGELLGYAGQDHPRPVPRVLAGLNPGTVNAFSRILARMPEAMTDILNQPSALEPQLRAAALPANMLALLRAGTGSRSLTFLVFREEPQDDWVKLNGARSVTLDTERLVAYESDIGQIDLHLGLPPGADAAALSGHPVFDILDAAQVGRRTVIDIQLPSTPPEGARPGLIWTRVRVALRSRELGDLGQFLTTVQARITDHCQPPAQLLVDVSTQAPPRAFVPIGPDDVIDLDDGPPPGDGPGPDRALLTPGELNVVPAGSTDQWLVLAVCAHAGTGVEAGLLRGLDRQRPDLRLAGLSTALMHGLTVMFVLAHRPMPTAEASGAAAPLRFRGGQVVVDEVTSVAGLLPDRPGPGSGSLLQLHVVCGDRPGLTGLLLDRLGPELANLFRVDIARLKPSVWYARTDVADGRLAVSRIMIRLAVPVPAELRLSSGQLDDVERALRRALRTAPATGPGTVGVPGERWWDARAVVSLHLVEGPGEDSRPSDVLEIPGPAASTQPQISQSSS